MEYPLPVEYAPGHIEQHAGDLPVQDTRPVIVEPGIEYPCDATEITDGNPGVPRPPIDTTYAKIGGSVCEQALPEQQTSTIYPNRFRAAQALADLERLVQDTPPEMAQANGNFGVIPTVWGASAVESAFYKEDDDALRAAIHNEHQRLIKATNIELFRVDQLAACMGLENLPASTLHSITGSDRPIDGREIFDRLVATDTTGHPILPEDILLGIMAAHVQNVTETQANFNLNLAAKNKEQFLRAAANAAVPPDGSQGWLPRQALANIESRAPRLRVLLDDGLSTIAQGRDAFAVVSNVSSIRHYVTIFNPLSFKDPHNRKHELTHALIDGEDEKGPYGLRSMFAEQSPVAALLREAVVDHVSLSFEAGKLIAPKPIAPWGYPTMYRAGSELLGVLSNRGTRATGFMPFIAANCENSDQAVRPGSATGDLRQRLHIAFPSDDVIHDIDSLMPPVTGRINCSSPDITAAARDYARYLMHRYGR